MVKKKKNMIFSLEGGNGIIKEQNQLLDHATQYYKSLFGPGGDSRVELDPKCWGIHEKISMVDNNHLTAPFTEEEVKRAIFDMEKNTAPGPDHIPIEFYQHCWEIIKGEIMDMFVEFYDGKLDLKRLNYGTITLLQKTKEANKIQQYRPICLLNVIYKIFTKVLMMRLETIMRKIINKSQNAFIKGRNIMDGIMCLHEILHDTKLRKENGVVLKLDFEKAYDKISWKFLKRCFEQRGFDKRWCDWIWAVMTSGTLNVKVNDSLGPYFMCGKGVRQGDPLSPPPSVQYSS